MTFPDAAYATALLGLPEMTPHRLAALFGMATAPEAGPAGSLFDPQPVAPVRRGTEVWANVRAGRAAEMARFERAEQFDPARAARRWAAAASGCDVGRIWDRVCADGIRVDLLGTAGYPRELAGDHRAPYVLFRKGTAPDLRGRRVAIIGTRRCTPIGRETAYSFGRDLTAAGVRVVSGLALGIDGAAHEGALSAIREERDRAGPPIGVTAGGLCVPYPARHRALWASVAATGVLISEWPPDTRSEGWRFPARNRIIAALGEAVVVIESRATGGSMITADEALRRDRLVLAVPGSVQSPASAGTNQLIRDGAGVACCVDDVLAALSLSSSLSGAGTRPQPDRRPVPSPPAHAVLDAVGWEPTSLEDVVARLGRRPADVMAALAELDVGGWIVGGGGWWQRVGPPA